MTAITFDLPWPDKRLSPNARGHWSIGHDAKRRALNSAFTLARKAGLHGLPVAERYAVRLVFHPADRRRRDLDNALASMKAALDGIAECMGVDDSTFRPVPEWGEPHKPALVRVTIEPMAPEAS